jgi:hypothetical protein
VSSTEAKQSAPSENAGWTISAEMEVERQAIGSSPYYFWENFDPPVEDEFYTASGQMTHWNFFEEVVASGHESRFAGINAVSNLTFGWNPGVLNISAPTRLYVYRHAHAGTFTEWFGSGSAWAQSTAAEGTGTQYANHVGLEFIPFAGTGQMTVTAAAEALGGSNLHFPLELTTAQVQAGLSVDIVPSPIISYMSLSATNFRRDYNDQDQDGSTWDRVPNERNTDGDTVLDLSVEGSNTTYGTYGFVAYGEASPQAETVHSWTSAGLGYIAPMFQSARSTILNVDIDDEDTWGNVLNLETTLDYTASRMIPDWADQKSFSRIKWHTMRENWRDTRPPITVLAAAVVHPVSTHPMEVRGYGIVGFVIDSPNYAWDVVTPGIATGIVSIVSIYNSLLGRIGATAATALSKANKPRQISFSEAWDSADAIFSNGKHESLKPYYWFSPTVFAHYKSHIQEGEMYDRLEGYIGRDERIIEKYIGDSFQAVFTLDAGY